MKRISGIIDGLMLLGWWGLLLAATFDLIDLPPKLVQLIAIGAMVLAWKSDRSACRPAPNSEENAA